MPRSEISFHIASPQGFEDCIAQRLFAHLHNPLAAHLPITAHLDNRRTPFANIVLLNLKRIFLRVDQFVFKMVRLVVVLFHEILKAHTLHFAHKRLHLNELPFFLHGAHKALAVIRQREERIRRHIVTKVVPVSQKVQKRGNAERENNAQACARELCYAPSPLAGNDE